MTIIRYRIIIPFYLSEPRVCPGVGSVLSIFVVSSQTHDPWRAPQGGQREMEVTGQ